MSDSQTLYKLMILYMLNQVNFPLSNAQLCEFILDREYTTYFTLQQSISELLEAGFVQMKSVSNTSLYELTEEGQNTLDYFKSRISTAIRDDIDAFLADHRYELRNETSMLADYYETPQGEYAARCQVKEKESTLIELTLTVPTEEQASSICANWKQKNEKVYAYLMEELL
ncbi:MAG: DUF4364 family protein [Lachnospiraceae bacterium]|nr:DUF4364 family protein [Lachnospiraceae bacterium]